MFAANEASYVALIFIRVTAMTVLLPNFAQVLSLRFRIVLAFAITLLIAPLRVGLPHEPFAGGDWIGAAIEQAFSGALLGATIRLWVSSCAVAGSWISQVAGWGVADVGPDGQEAAPALGQLQGWVGGLVFLAIDGPWMVIRALMDSFSAVPIAGMAWHATPITEVVSTTLNQSFWLSLRIGSPVLASVVASSIGVAAIQRAIPNVNLVRFQIAGNWLVLLVAMTLTLGLNTERWGKDVAGLLQDLPRQWNRLSHDSRDSSPSSRRLIRLKNKRIELNFTGRSPRGKDEFQRRSKSSRQLGAASACTRARRNAAQS